MSLSHNKFSKMPLELISLIIRKLPIPLILSFLFCSVRYRSLFKDRLLWDFLARKYLTDRHLKNSVSEGHENDDLSAVVTRIWIQFKYLCLFRKKKVYNKIALDCLNYPSPDFVFRRKNKPNEVFTYEQQMKHMTKSWSKSFDITLTSEFLESYFQVLLEDKNLINTKDINSSLWFDINLELATRYGSEKIYTMILSVVPTFSAHNRYVIISSILVTLNNVIYYDYDFLLKIFFDHSIHILKNFPISFAATIFLEILCCVIRLGSVKCLHVILNLEIKQIPEITGEEKTIMYLTICETLFHRPVDLLKYFTGVSSSLTLDSNLTISTKISERLLIPEAIILLYPSVLGVVIALDGEILADYIISYLSRGNFLEEKTFSTLIKFSLMVFPQQYCPENFNFRKQKIFHIENRIGYTVVGKKGFELRDKMSILYAEVTNLTMTPRKFDNPVNPYYQLYVESPCRNLQDKLSFEESKKRTIMMNRLKYLKKVLQLNKSDFPIDPKKIIASLATYEYYVSLEYLLDHPDVLHSVKSEESLTGNNIEGNRRDNERNDKGGDKGDNKGILGQFVSDSEPKIRFGNFNYEMILFLLDHGLPPEYPPSQGFFYFLFTQIIPLYVSGEKVTKRDDLFKTFELLVRRGYRVEFYYLRFCHLLNKFSSRKSDENVDDIIIIQDPRDYSPPVKNISDKLREKYAIVFHSDLLARQKYLISKAEK
jgi:hypothetical protein